LSRFCPRGILVFSHYLNFGQRGILKYLIFGSLFILVRFVVFKCFTLRCFQITFFSQFYYFYILVQILLKIAFQSKYFDFFANLSQFFWKQSNSFISFKKETVQILNCKTVPFFHICRLVLKVKNKSIQSKRPRKQFHVQMSQCNWSKCTHGSL